MTMSCRDEEWRNELTRRQFEFGREKGAEAPFSGQYTDCKTAGMYARIRCGAELFDFRSSWPSFWTPAGLRNCIISAVLQLSSR